jgi:chromate transporter
VLAIVIDAILRIARRAFTNTLSFVIAVAAFAALFLFNVAFPVVILAAGLAGLAGAALLPPAPHARSGGEEDPAYTHAVDAALARGDLSHTLTVRGQTLRTALTWLAIWLAPVGLLLLALGPDHVLARLALLLSGMSVVTFGGAYAVLAYVAQEAVATYQWLSAAEMMDGLALAETTPGPLILVLQHVGFLAASRQAGFDPVLAGLAGAAVTLWVTFVPSFLWIFAGAPHAERLRGNKALSGALAAITAAVVGVIANLAAWFGLHVLFAQVERVATGPFLLQVPDVSTLDPWALGLSVVATVLLLGGRVNVPVLLAGCAIAGIVLRVGLA